MYKASIRIDKDKVITLHADTHSDRLVRINSKIIWHKKRLRHILIGYFVVGGIIFALLVGQIERPNDLVVVAYTMPFIWLVAEAVEFYRTNRRCSFAQRCYHHYASLRKWRAEHTRHNNFESSYTQPETA